MGTSLEGVNKEIMESYINDAIGEKHILDILNINPRALFDFFDEKNIFIEILVKDGFKYKIYSSTDITSSEEVFNNRKDVEKAAISKAFDILEENLTVKNAGQDSTTSHSEVSE